MGKRFLSVVLTTQLVFGGFLPTAFDLFPDAQAADSPPLIKEMETSFDTSFKEAIGGDQIKAAQDVFAKCEQMPFAATLQSLAKTGVDLASGKTEVDAKQALGLGCGDVADSVLGGKLSCEILQGPMGAVDPNEVKKYKDAIDKNSAIISCRQDRYKEINVQMDCMVSQARALAGQIRGMQQNFTSHYAQATEYLNGIKSLQKDRASQIDQIKDRLESKGGMLELQAEVQSKQGSLRKAITGFDSARQEIANQRKFVDKFVENKKLALGMKCFKEGKIDSSLQDVNTGEVLSPYDFLIKNFSSQAHVGKTSDGKSSRIRTESKDSNKKNEVRSEKALKNILDNIIAAAPTVTEIPADPAQLKTLVNQQRGVRKLDDVRKYDKEFDSVRDKFNFKNKKGEKYPLKEWVRQAINKCYLAAASEVNAELFQKDSQGKKERTADSGITNHYTRIDGLEKETNDSSALMIDEYTLLFTRARTSLTEQHVNMPNLDCKNPASHVTCLKRYEEGLKTLLHSNVGPQVGFPIPLKVNNAAAFKPIACGGLTDCITVLQRESGNFKRDIEGVDHFVKSYAVPRIKKQVQEATTQMQKAVAQRTPFIQQRMDAINGLARMMGLRGFGKTGQDSNRSSKGQKPDEFGLMPPPEQDEIIGLLGGGMAGLLEDAEKESAGSEMRAELSSRIEEMSKLKTKAEEESRELENKKATCLEEAKKKAKLELDEKLKNVTSFKSAFAEGQCHLQGKYCGAQTQYEQLISVINAMKLDSNLKGPMTTFERGARVMCPDPVPPTGQIGSNPVAAPTYVSAQRPLTAAECSALFSDYENVLGDVKSAADKLNAIGGTVK